MWLIKKIRKKSNVLINVLSEMPIHSKCIFCGVEKKRRKTDDDYEWRENELKIKID